MYLLTHKWIFFLIRPHVHQLLIENRRDNFGLVWNKLFYLDSSTETLLQSHSVILGLVYSKSGKSSLAGLDTSSSDKHKLLSENVKTSSKWEVSTVDFCTVLRSVLLWSSALQPWMSLTMTGRYGGCRRPFSAWLQSTSKKNECSGNLPCTLLGIPSLSSALFTSNYDPIKEVSETHMLDRLTWLIRLCRSFGMKQGMVTLRLQMHQHSSSSSVPVSKSGSQARREDQTRPTCEGIASYAH